MAQEVGVSTSSFASGRNGNFVQMKISNSNFHSNWLEQKKWSISEDHLFDFVPENFHMNRIFYLHFNQLDQKF